MKFAFLEKPSTVAHVLEEDEHGVWILVGEKEIGQSESVIPAMLLKWEYIVTASLDYQHREPSETMVEI